jgi:hypothetical protein
MRGKTRVLLEAKPDRPGLITLLDDDCAAQAHLPLAPMKRNEILGLANELCARGVEVDLRDVETTPRPVPGSSDRTTQE